jgi:hypothetical protein
VAAFVNNNRGLEMVEYNFTADILNKFSQLVPWVQALIGVSLILMAGVVAFFAKETVLAIAAIFTENYKRIIEDKLINNLVGARERHQNSGE